MTSVFGRREVILPPAVALPGIAAVARKVLRERGYLIRQDDVTMDKVEIVATPAGDAIVDRIEVSVRAAREGSRLVVLPSPPDGAASRNIMDAVLAGLGWKPGSIEIDADGNIVPVPVAAAPASPAAQRGSTIDAVRGVR